MKTKINYIIIAKDGFPLEEFQGRPITNFFRKLLHGHHKECLDCWIRNEAKENTEVPFPCCGFTESQMEENTRNFNERRI